MDEEEYFPFPQVRLVSFLPFAPPVPVVEFPGPDKIEQMVMEILSVKGIPEFVKLLEASRG